METTASPMTYGQNLGAGMAALSVLPFVLFLIIIAVFPLIPRLSLWWRGRGPRRWTALAFALAGAGVYLIVTGDWTRIGWTFLEYLAFLSLLSSLYIITGGVHIGGSFAGFPRVNTLLLALGALAANLIGTTGASMLLIRPLLHANRARRHRTHLVVFFIFIVSNCAGLLTPLGDPPLYLGFLRAVPFDWTFGLAKEWAFMILGLLTIFHFLDEWMFEREDLETKGSLVSDTAKAGRRIHIQGGWNLAALGAVMACILVAGYWIQPTLTAAWGAETAEWISKIFQILAMGSLAYLSWRRTPRRLHELNRFSLEPIEEVAVLFFGIFGAMIPALALVQAHGPAWSLTKPWQYFWATGSLSALLDNAPTYLSMATLAASRFTPDSSHLGILAARHPSFLAAVSCGAVFMGALTYIGNGPNFMVKALAEQAGIRMPSFGGYLLWSLGILGPLLLIQTLVFFQ